MNLYADTDSEGQMCSLILAFAVGIGFEGTFLLGTAHMMSSHFLTLVMLIKFKYHDHF